MSRWCKEKEDFLDECILSRNVQNKPWGAISVGKMPVVQRFWPEFKPPEPTRKAKHSSGLSVVSVTLWRDGRWRQEDSWELKVTLSQTRWKWENQHPWLSPNLHTHAHMHTGIHGHTYSQKEICKTVEVISTFFFVPLLIDWMSDWLILILFSSLSTTTLGITCQEVLTLWYHRLSLRHFWALIPDLSNSLADLLFFDSERCLQS